MRGYDRRRGLTASKAALLGSLLGCLGGCGPSRHSAERVVAATPIKSYPHEMAPVEKARFLASLGALMPGESREDVVRALGAPHAVVAIGGLEMFSRVRGVSLQYYISKAKPNEINDLRDRFVSAHFDNAGKLVRVGTNVEGLALKVTQTLQRGAHLFCVPAGGEPRKMVPGERVPP